MRTWRSVIILTVVATILVSMVAFTPRRQVTAQNNEGCPPAEVISAQSALVEDIIDELVAIRAYKDATLNELAQRNLLYYALRGDLLRALLARTALITERNALLEDAPVSPEALPRLLEIENELLELAVVLEGANTALQEQLVLLAELWQPVLGASAGVSVERYERFTQRILEVREGDADTALELAQEIANAMLACTDEVAQPPAFGTGGSLPTGVGSGQTGRPRPTATPTRTPVPTTPPSQPGEPVPSGVGS